MKISTKSVLSVARRKPLAACCALLFALATPEALAANNLIVTNCFDSGGGSLRDVVTNLAQDGDTVDMTGLSCVNSTISLTTGAVVVNQANLTLLGPGSSRLKINSGGNSTASHDNGIINHQGTGTLSVQDLELTGGGGHYYNVGSISVTGGCIYSKGNVILSNALVDFCSVSDFSNVSATRAWGGGIYTVGNLNLINSVIDGNYVGASPASSANSIGGGAFVGKNFTSKYSTISGNQAGFTTVLGEGGGLEVFGNVSISNSTIAYNTANYAVGGLEMGFGTSATITNSTISHNSAPKFGGLFSAMSTTINNSSIAFNQKSAVTGGSAGATFSAQFGSIAVNLHSTLISNNTYLKSGVLTSNDIGTANTSTNTVTFTTDTQQGNFNLIRALDATVSASSLPPDTIIGKCPLLGPLKNNGGTTLTHALYSGSPAIDTGINGADLVYDQRGGPQPVVTPIPPPPQAYERFSGVRIDIGAYEFQYSDNIFSAGFEGCP